MKKTKKGLLCRSIEDDNTLLLISLNLHILRKRNLIIAQHQLYFPPFVKVQEQNRKFQSFSLLISKCLELESYVSKRFLCYPCVPDVRWQEVFMSITFLCTCMLRMALVFPQTLVRVNKVSTALRNSLFRME